MDECFLVGKLLPGIFGFLFGSCLGSGGGSYGTTELCGDRMCSRHRSVPLHGIPHVHNAAKASERRIGYGK